MIRRSFLLALVITLSLFTAAWAAQETLTFKGSITLTIGDSDEIEVNGTKTITMPKPFAIELQDNHPSVIANIFMEQGRQTERPAIAVTTTETFMVKGKALREIFTLRGSGDKIKLLSIGKGNFTIPDVTEDYYLAIDVPSENDEDEEIDAATLYYIKMCVQGSEPAPETKFPMFGHCTGDNVRLREKPGTKSKVIGKFDTMDWMTIFDDRAVKGEVWYLVEPEKENLRGWINGRYVEVE